MKSLRNLFLFLAFLFSSSLAVAQLAQLEFRANIGSVSLDDIYDVCTTFDGNYVYIGGKDSSNIDLNIVGKTDLQGNVLWEKKYSGPSPSRGIAIYQLMDSTLLTFTLSSNGILSGLLATKLDPNGNVIWNRLVGGSLSSAEDISLHQNPDSTLVITVTENNEDEFSLIKMNPAGTELWVREIGLNGSNASMVVYDLTPTQDGGYMLAGGGVANNRGGAFLLKVDSLGTPQFIKVKRDHPYYESIDPLPNGNFAVGGEYGPNPLGEATLVAEVDNQGDIVWANGYQAGQGGSFGKVLAVPDGYLVTTLVAVGRLKAIKLDSVGNILNTELLTFSTPIRNYAFIKKWELDDNGSAHLFTGIYAWKMLDNLTTCAGIQDSSWVVPALYSQDTFLLSAYSYNYPPRSMNLTANPDNSFNHISFCYACSISPTFTVSNSTPCVGDTVFFTFTGSGATDFDWTVDQSPIATTMNSSFVFNASGNYSVKLVASESSCSDSTEILINVGAIPAANAGNDQSICMGDSVQLSASGGVTYRWSPSLGLSDTTTNSPIANPSQSTLYQLEVDGQNGCRGLDSVWVFVNSLPSVSLSTFPDFCEQDSAYVLMEGSPAGGMYSGPGVSGGNFTPQTVGPGTYEVSYTYSDSNGCASGTEDSILVNASPMVSFSGLNPAYCHDSTHFSLTGVPAGGTFSGPGVTGNTFNPFLAGVGTHTITYGYSDANSCSATSQASVQVNANPVVSLTGLDTLYCNTNTNNTVLIGTPAGGIFSGSGVTGNFFNPFDAGTGLHVVSYVYVDSNGCEGTADQLTQVDICQSRETSWLFPISVYPNPAYHHLFIETGQTGELAFSLYDLSGRLVLDQKVKLTSTSEVIQLNVSNFKPGLYHLVLTKEEAIWTQKVLIREVK